jgi:uncharacterized protein YggE
MRVFISKRMKKHLATAIFLAVSITLFSQERLAYIYGRDEYAREAQKTYRPPVQLWGDSVLIISSAVLMNVKPDRYAVTLGAGQTAATPLQAGKLMGERIQKFREKITKLNIGESDIYIDFISQNKVYDFDLAGNKAIEKETGFEIKKNITLFVNEESTIEAITEAAAEQQIFDVIKVEYLLSDYTSLYKQLFAETVQQIKERKEMYMTATGMAFLPSSALHTDNLTVIFPSTQYKKYTAYESGDVEANYNTRLVKKELRKASTAYYQGISQHGFDKIFNNNKPGVFIQLALGVSIKYYIKK